MLVGIVDGAAGLEEGGAQVGADVEQDGEEEEAGGAHDQGDVLSRGWHGWSHLARDGPLRHCVSFDPDRCHHRQTFAGEDPVRRRPCLHWCERQRHRARRPGRRHRHASLSGANPSHARESLALLNLTRSTPIRVGQSSGWPPTIVNDDLGALAPLLFPGDAFRLTAPFQHAGPFA